MKFNPGDKVYCKQYGKGKCYKIDENDNFMTYLFRFYNGTLIWMPKNLGERIVKIRKNAQANA